MENNFGHFKFKRYIDIKGPKPAIKQAFRDEIILDGQGWINMLDDRNRSSHLYNEVIAHDIFDKIQLQYFGLLTAFKNEITSQLKQ